MNTFNHVKNVLYTICTQKFSFSLTENKIYTLCKNLPLNTLPKRWPTLARKRTHSLFWVGLPTACAKLTISSMFNLVNCYVIYVYFTKPAAGRRTQPGRQQILHPSSTGK
jgi:hypothetical protein